MRIFQIKEDSSTSKAGYIDTVHKWGLPGVDCPVCNCIWSAVGLEYPSIDLSNFSDEKLYRQARLEKLDVFLGLRKKIADAFPQLPLLEPGTEFGHSVGQAVGQLSGFVWRAGWTISLESNALQKLANAPLNLPVAVKAELKFKKDAQQVFEFDLPLKGEMINGVYDSIQIKYCHSCGRDSASKPEEILINRLSIPDDIDIFRVANFTTIILATERFVGTVTNLNIKGAVFEEIKIV